MLFPTWGEGPQGVGRGKVLRDPINFCEFPQEKEEKRPGGYPRALGLFFRGKHAAGNFFSRWRRISPPKCIREGSGRVR